MSSREHSERASTGAVDDLSQLEKPPVWKLEYEGYGDFKLTLNGREAFWLGCSPEWQQGDRDELAALVSSAARVEGAQSAWAWLSANVGLELTWGEIDGDLSECAWRVHRVNGGINDREWTLVAIGDTPLDAVQAARTALTGMSKGEEMAGSSGNHIETSRAAPDGASNEVEFHMVHGRWMLYFPGVALDTVEQRQDFRAMLLPVEEAEIEPPSPAAAIRFRMEQAGYTRADLAKIVGTRARAAEILSGKREPSKAHIRRLVDEWGIPARSLLGSALDADASPSSEARARNGSPSVLDEQLIGRLEELVKAFDGGYHLTITATGKRFMGEVLAQDLRGVLALLREGGEELTASQGRTDPRGTDWQPIDSAPHDTDVLLYCPQLALSNPERIELGPAVMTHGREQGWSYHSWATHWMPLPPAPAEGR